MKAPSQEVLPEVSVLASAARGPAALAARQSLHGHFSLLQLPFWQALQAAAAAGSEQALAHTCACYSSQVHRCDAPDIVKSAAYQWMWAVARVARAGSQVVAALSTAAAGVCCTMLAHGHLLGRDLHHDRISGQSHA